jgi:hypothetical protein
MRQVFAYSFASPRSLADVQSEFNELGPWNWIERDNDNYGEYISSRVLETPHYGMIKVFTDGGQFAINVRLESDEPDALAQFASIKEAVFKRLLPAIDAAEIAPAETYE